MIEINNMAMTQNAECQRIKNYLTGKHSVLNRKNFAVGKDKTFTTAKIVLQSIKQVIIFHSAYIGNEVSLSGEKEVTSLLQSVYKRGMYAKNDYQITQNLISYGNSFEYVFKDKGVIKSKIISPVSAFPIYENGEYTKFIEKYCYHPVTDDTFERLYTDGEVIEYRNGVMTAKYRNPSGLPIHYTSFDFNKSEIFGTGLVSQLIPISDEIEFLLSKMSDSINSLSMSPLLLITGQRIEGESSDIDTIGQVLNLDDGNSANFISSTLDYNSIKLLIDNLLNSFYTVAMVPSSLFGQGNISNISSVSLAMLYNSTDSYARQISWGLQEGFRTRLEYISKLIGADVTGVEIDFNYNRPVDNKSNMESMKLQWDMGAISKQSIIKNSPYTQNLEKELELIQSESDVMSTNKVSHDKLVDNQSNEDKGTEEE